MWIQGPVIFIFKENMFKTGGNCWVIGLVIRKKIHKNLTKISIAPHPGSIYTQVVKMGQSESFHEKFYLKKLHNTTHVCCNKVQIHFKKMRYIFFWLFLTFFRGQWLTFLSYWRTCSVFQWFECLLQRYWREYSR